MRTNSGYLTIDENTSSTKNAMKHSKNTVSISVSAVFVVNANLISSMYKHKNVITMKMKLENLLSIVHFMHFLDFSQRVIPCFNSISLRFPGMEVTYVGLGSRFKIGPSILFPLFKKLSSGSESSEFGTFSLEALTYKTIS